MAAAAILDLLFVDSGPPTMSQLLGPMLPGSGVMISLICPRYYDFTISRFWLENAFPDNFWGFWEILTP